MTIKRTKRYFANQLLKIENCTLTIEDIEKLTIIKILEETERLKSENAERERSLLSYRFGARY